MESFSSEETITKVKARGTIAEVWNGTAKRTAGGLTKDDITTNKHGKPISKKKQEAARKLVASGKLRPYSKKSQGSSSVDV